MGARVGELSLVFLQLVAFFAFIVNFNVAPSPAQRHGARTPLTKRAELWAGQQWDVCGRAYYAVPLEVRSVDGQTQPLNPDDLKQLSAVMPGALSQCCRKGRARRAVLFTLFCPLPPSASIAVSLLVPASVGVQGVPCCCRLGPRRVLKC